jgi:predicted N-acetyltransferase YhbS
MNTIHIRPYTTNDYTLVRRNMEEGGLYYPEIDAEQKLNEKITRNPGSILVAELNGAVIGNVLIMEDGWGPFFFRLAVAKDYRGKGVGSRLLEEVVRVLAEKGYQEVYCLVNDGDTELKLYYKKRGFEEGDKPYRVMFKRIQGIR